MVKPIFVVGSPRSGTTVLGACLSAHPGIGSSEESMFLGSLARIYQNFFRGKNPRNWAPLQKYISEAGLVESLGACADDILSSLLANLGKPRYLDHTPWYGSWMGFINLIYPDSVFIHVIRDGRDVVDSLTHSHQHGFEWAGDSFEERIRLWVRMTTLPRRSAQELNFVSTHRYKEILYEDLCANPYRTLEDILQFLELPMVSDTLVPLSKVHASPSRTNRTLAAFDQQGALRVQPAKTGHSWPKHWELTDRNQFLELGGATLEAFGYLAKQQNSLE